MSETVDSPEFSHAYVVMMDLTRRLAQAVRAGHAARRNRLMEALRTLEQEYPAAAAAIEARYPTHPITRSPTP